MAFWLASILAIAFERGSATRTKSPGAPLPLRARQQAAIAAAIAVARLIISTSLLLHVRMSLLYERNSNCRAKGPAPISACGGRPRISLILKRRGSKRICANTLSATRSPVGTNMHAPHDPFCQIVDDVSTCPVSVCPVAVPRLCVLLCGHSGRRAEHDPHEQHAVGDRRRVREQRGDELPVLGDCGGRATPSARTRSGRWSRAACTTAGDRTLKEGEDLATDPRGCPPTRAPPRLSPLRSQRLVA